MVHKLSTLGLGFYMSDKEQIPKLGMYLSVSCALEWFIGIYKAVHSYEPFI